MTGVFDVLAREDGGGLLVVDYKTGGVAAYDAQRLIYAIAALRTGALAVEVVHCFLDAGGLTAERFEAGERERLEAELRARADGVVAGRFGVADEPRRSLCAGCPALGGLCSWPAEIALRDAVDRLF